jgi:hypothetical protein
MTLRSTHRIHPSLRMPAFALSITALASPAMAAGEEPIVTDRPDFVESSQVVGKGRLQIETSLAAERDRAGGATERTTSTPTLLRIGASDSIELRLETDGRMHAWSGEAGGHGRTGERGDRQGERRHA